MPVTENMMMNEANITTPTNGCRMRASCGVPLICINQLKDGNKSPAPLTAADEAEGGDPVVDTFRRGVA